jgi:hypothetical protein
MNQRYAPAGTSPPRGAMRREAGLPFGNEP